MLKNMASALPQDSGENQSAEELESIIFVKWERLNLIMYKNRGIYHDIKFNRTEVYLRPHVNVKIAFSLA